MLEPLLTTMQGQQVVLLECLSLEFPNAIGTKRVVTGERKSKRSLTLIPGETCGSIEHSFQVMPLRKILGRITRQLPSDLFQLLAIRELVLDHHHQLLQFHWQLHHRRQDYHERPLPLPGDELREQGLNDLGGV